MEREYDPHLARECAEAFHQATHLGCTVTNRLGQVQAEYGYGCAACQICRLAGVCGEKCGETQLYGMQEAERFGGKYVYFCAMGLTCFVSPILGREEAVARVTVGPFLMVEPEDYAAYELETLHALPESAHAAVLAELEKVPFVPPGDVTALSTLLGMAVGFLHNAEAAGSILEQQRSTLLQQQLSTYVADYKQEGQLPQYPFRLEQALTQHIAQGDREKSQEVLNAILGHVLFSSGGHFPWIRARCYELLVTISRTAVHCGADPTYILQLGDEYSLTIPQCENMETLAMHLATALRRCMDLSFGLPDARHTDAIHNAMYFIRQNYRQKITLEDAAKNVYLSSTYLSRIFKQETGTSFTRYLNQVRVDHSLRLLQMTDLRLTEIAAACGFEDQSYFTKVFRSITGETPWQYRKRMQNQ